MQLVEIYRLRAWLAEIYLKIVCTTSTNSLLHNVFNSDVLLKLQTNHWFFMIIIVIHDILFMRLFWHLGYECTCILLQFTTRHFIKHKHCKRKLLISYLGTDWFIRNIWYTVTLDKVKKTWTHWSLASLEAMWHDMTRSQCKMMKRGLIEWAH